MQFPLALNPARLFDSGKPGISPLNVLKTQFANVLGRQSPGYNAPVGGNTSPVGGNAPFIEDRGSLSAGQTLSVGTGTGASASASGGDAAQLGSLRSEITARRERANSIFDALTGAVSALAQEKRNALESQFATEQGRAVGDYLENAGTLARTYRARGIGDSSYKINALDRASSLQARALEDLGSQRLSGLSKVGGEAVGAQAKINADRSSIAGINLDEVGRKDDGTYDTSKLIELRNDLDQRIRDAETQQAQFGKDAGFRGKLDQIAPYAGTTAALKGALQSLVQSATPPVVRDRIAAAIISNYAPQDASVWQNYYDQEKQKTTTG